MSDIPANYRDPEPGHMGWQWDGLKTRQKLAIEEMRSESLPTQLALSKAKAASDIPPEIENQIRARFRFDTGWSFYECNRLIYGGDLTFNQSVGNCVGASHVMILASRIAHEVLAEGDLEEPLGDGNLGMPLCAFSYGAGRHKGGLTGNGDGSFCGAQLEATHEYGFLPCFLPGVDAYGSLPQGSASANKTFGRNFNECRKWLTHAGQYKLLESPRIRTVAELKEAVVDKKLPLQICSGQGFTFWKNDSKYGPLYRRGGSWAHSMSIMMVCEVGGQWLVTVNNQWGTNAHRHNDLIGAAPGSFTIPIEELEPWLRRAHCEAIGEIEGLKTTLTLAA